MNVQHPWHGVSPGNKGPGTVNALIEIPKGSRAKYEIEKTSGLLKLDRVIYSSFHYPANYGFIPQSLGYDNDPLDILVLCSQSLQPLCIVEATVIGNMQMIDNGEQDDKKATSKQAAMVETAFGRTGDAKKAVRTIAVDMSDRMRFSPASISVKRGETVKFVVRNSGKTMHEFVLGTLPELKEHAELMKKHPGMEHDEPYMAHVAPGRTETVVWQFTKAGEFHFG